MKRTSPFFIALLAGALSIVGCSEDGQATGGAGGFAGVGGVSGAGGVGGAGGAPDQVCTFGLCMEDEEAADNCLEGYDACVGRGESPRSCGMEADMDCGVFSGVGGAGSAPYIVCTLGLCMEDEELAANCLEVYDACVDRGHYPRSCRMEADMTCGVFGETGPY